MEFYKKWHQRLPIECAVNLALLHKEYRRIIQIDMSYYNSSELRAEIRSCVGEMTGVESRIDSCGNLVLYLSKHKVEIEKCLCEIGDGKVDDAFRTAAFADLLDQQFYENKGDLTRIFTTTRVIKVSINVIKDATDSGALMVQMCDTDLQTHNLYARFLQVSNEVEKLDPSLQTTLTFHTKPGLWKDTPDYWVDRHRKLPVI